MKRTAGDKQIMPNVDGIETREQRLGIYLLPRHVVPPVLFPVESRLQVRGDKAQRN